MKLVFLDKLGYYPFVGIEIKDNVYGYFIDAVEGHIIVACIELKEYKKTGQKHIYTLLSIVLHDVEKNKWRTPGCLKDNMKASQLVIINALANIIMKYENLDLNKFDTYIMEKSK